MKSRGDKKWPYVRRFGRKRVFKEDLGIDESNQLEDTFREESKDVNFNDDGSSCLTFPLKDCCHSPERGPDLYLLRAMYIGPGPLTGATAHPETISPVFHSSCLDPSMDWGPVGIVKGVPLAIDLPQSPRERLDP